MGPSVWFQDLTASGIATHADAAIISTASTSTTGNSTAGAGAAASETHDWIICFQTNSVAGMTSIAQTTSLLTDSGVCWQALRGLGSVGLVLVRSSGATVNQIEATLSADTDVRYFELDGLQSTQTTTGTTTIPSENWALENTGQTGGTADADIDASSAWSLSTGSDTVVVAVLDSGVDYTNSSLASNIWVNTREIAGNGIDDDGNGLVDDVYGYDFANNDGDPLDDNGHGTHVAGVIGAMGDEATGVNRHVSILALKFLDADGTGYASDAIRAINYVTLLRTKYGVNVRVINCSWGNAEYSAAMSQAITAAGKAGILFVAAAGNSGTNVDASPCYPGSHTSASILTVAATDANDQLATFSNYGVQSVDLAAPGVFIKSTVLGNETAWYSGTSMATAYVSAVAALAWSVAPTASVAMVRAAILGGTDKMSSLSGKVASGGRLNACNTLAIFAGRAACAPIIGALGLSSTTTSVGTTVTVTAEGVMDADGAVTSVSLYEDTNGNGRWDASDVLLGTATTIADDKASLSFSTSGMSAGEHLLFARAKDNSAKWSTLASSIVLGLNSDRVGNNSATATRLHANTAVSGAVDCGSDADWYEFDALAGLEYTIQADLGTLSGSTLAVYGSDGTTQLALLACTESANELVWTAATTGTYYVEVAASDSATTGEYSLKVVALAADPLAIDTITDQTMNAADGSLTVTLVITGGNGTALTGFGWALNYDSLSQKAYELEQTYHFSVPTTGYDYNAHYAQEKYLVGNSGTRYFLLPNGELHQWNGAIHTSPLVASFSAAYYNNPALLYNAQAPSLEISPVATIVNDAITVTVTPTHGYLGSFYVQCGVIQYVDPYTTTSAEVIFKVTVTDTAPILVEIPDQTLEYREYTRSITLSAADADNNDVFYSAKLVTVDPMKLRALNWDSLLDLTTPADYQVNARGAQEKNFQSANGTYYYLLPNGEFHIWGGSLESSPLLDTFTPDYYDTPTLLTAALRPATTTMYGVALSVSDNVLTMTANKGISGTYYVLVTVTDKVLSSQQTFVLTVPVSNVAPVLEAIDDQTVSYLAAATDVLLTVIDDDPGLDGDGDGLTDGDTIAFSVALYTTEAMAQLAYDLDQSLGLYTTGNYWQNRLGAREKYLAGAGNLTYFLLPNGQLHLFNGTISTSPLVATLATEYYYTPTLLCNAARPTQTVLNPDNDPNLTGTPWWSITDNVLTIYPNGYYGEIFITVTASDGIASSSQQFRLSMINHDPELATDAPGNQVAVTTGDDATVVLTVTDPDPGDTLTLSASVVSIDPYAQFAYELRTTYGLTTTGNLYENFRGLNEKYLLGRGNLWYYLLPDGELYVWTGSISGSVLVGKLTPAYYDDPSLVYNAQEPGPIPTTGITLSFSESDLVITGVTAGTYQVLLTVTDAKDAVAGQVLTVTVTDPIFGEETITDMTNRVEISSVADTAPTASRSPATTLVLDRLYASSITSGTLL